MASMEEFVLMDYRRGKILKRPVVVARIIILSIGKQ